MSAYGMKQAIELAGVKLFVGRNGKLRYVAPPQGIDDWTLKNLRENRDAILAIMDKPEPWNEWEATHYVDMVKDRAGRMPRRLEPGPARGVDAYRG